MGEENFGVGDAFVVDEVAAHGLAIDDDAVGETVGEFGEETVPGGEEFAVAEVAGDDGGQTGVAAGWGGEDAGGDVVGVDEADGMLVDVSFELDKAGEDGTVAEGADVEAGDRDAGGADLFGTVAFVEAGHVGREFLTVDGEGELSEVAFAAATNGEFTDHEQDGRRHGRYFTQTKVVTSMKVSTSWRTRGFDWANWARRRLWGLAIRSGRIRATRSVIWRKPMRRKALRRPG